MRPNPRRPFLTNRLLLSGSLLALLALLAVPAPPLPAGESGNRAAREPSRAMALTFDDLPGQTTRRETAVYRQLNDAILAALAAHQAPAIGFVNEVKLYAEAEGRRRGGAIVEPPADPPLPDRVAIFSRWLAAGHQLGNHTFSHPDLHRIQAGPYKRDILHGEAVTRPLIEAGGGALRYFRHPFLHTGRSLEIKSEVEGYLGELGYRVAPVTIDNQEWIFARAYDVALDRDDAELADRIATEYLDYMLAMVVYYERQADAIVGGPLPQVLLLHANRLNAATLDELLERIAGRGYRFITLAEALEHPAYERADSYTGPAGITWLHRWAITAGMPGSTFAGEPEVAAFIHEASGL